MTRSLEDVKRAWHVEAERRLDELRRGVVGTEPTRQVFQRARASTHQETHPGYTRQLAD